MATSNISNFMSDPTGNDTPEYVVTVRLMPGPGFRVSDSTEVAPVVITTSVNGAWDLDLERNSNITPADSWYEVEEAIPTIKGPPRVWAIEVGDDDATLLAARVNPSTNPAFANYLTQADADARYQRLGTGSTNFELYVDDYGAVGNGVADDTAAFNLTKAALPYGGIMRGSPHKTYNLSTFALDVGGLIFRGAGVGVTKLRITGSASGVVFRENDIGLMDCTVQAADSSGTDELVRIEAHGSTNANRPWLRNVLFNGNAVAGIVGLYIRGVQGEAGVYNGLYENVRFIDCTTAVKTYTVGTGTDTPVSDTSHQKNAAHKFDNLIISGCTTGVLADTALNYVFSNADIESNTLGVSVDYIQQWGFEGGYGVIGNTTNWSIGTNAKGQIGVSDTNGDGDAVFLNAACGSRTGSVVTVAKIRGSRPSDYPGGISRCVTRGETDRVYEFDQQAAFSTAGASSAAAIIFTPNTTQVAASKASAYHVTCEIVGQEDGAGDTASYELKGTFKAVNTAGTIAVTQVSTTTVVHSKESNAGWDAVLGLSGTTGIRPLVSGAAGNGTIRWTVWMRVVEVRGQ